ncbi:MAG TPA: tRNA (N6-threonylcarbamoyladenosine(37)-N6)-methyltransferase TrmO [Planctomycetota bacterium]|nr:tRNA (N6-threonylcarbamoyladenosine(37)-N6)-methyltransferase TrmO [Planctomycetota bacterium]
MTSTSEPDPDTEWTMLVRPVAFMRCSQRLHHEAPRQARLGGADDEVRGFVVVRHGLQNLLQDLAGFSHVWLLFACHLTRGYRDQVQPPRDVRKRGLFATRTPNRPNPIGLSAVRLLRIERRVLHVGAHDLLDGTPVLDIKPYVPAYDAIPDARAGWVEGIPPGRPDHRAWWRERGVAPPRVYERLVRTEEGGGRTDAPPTGNGS